MEMNLETVDAPPRPAATVMVVRDAPDGLEIFLVKRHALSSVLAGAHVFPGGKVDDHDRLSTDHPVWAPSAPDLRARLNEPGIDRQTAASLYLAAIRETFEESGVLLARGARHKQARQAAALVRQGLRFDEALTQIALQLDGSELLPWSRWITPRVPMVTNKRFDTRFFVAPMPPGQTAEHDNREAIESLWIRPRDALQQYWAGGIALAPPQIMTLAHLSHYPTVGQLLAVRQKCGPALIAPEPFESGDGRIVCYPGDERHSDPGRAMPGPTRLAFRKGRFEPPGGFDAFFSPSSID